MHKNEKTESEMALIPSDIRPLIHEIRGVQVILDRDLAFLYGVLTKNLNKAVKPIVGSRNVGMCGSTA